MITFDESPKQNTRDQAPPNGNKIKREEAFVLSSKTKERELAS